MRPLVMTPRSGCHWSSVNTRVAVKVQCERRLLQRTTPIARFYLNLYLLIAAVYLLSASGRIGLSDGVAMFNVAQSIVNEKSLSAEPCDPQLPGHPNHCVLGVDGRYYSGFGLVPSLLVVPAVLCGESIAGQFHVGASAVLKVSVSLFTVLVSPLVCVVLAMWILKLGYSRRTAILGACILAFASPFWHFSVKGFYSEPYFTLALALAAFLLSRPGGPLAAGLSGFAFGVACGCRINGMIFFPAFILALAFHVRARGLPAVRFFREAGLFTLAFSSCAALIGWANYTRFGSPWKSGYQIAYPSLSSLFSTPLFHGMYELLFNGEVGLLIFAPWVIVALICFPSFVRAHLPDAVLCGTVFIFSFLFFAKYDSWHGGWVAGPRFLTPTLPFLIMAVVPCIESLQHRSEPKNMPQSWAVLRTTMMVLVIAAALIQSLGVIFPEERYYVLMGLYGDNQLIGFYGDSRDIIGLYKGTRVKPWWVGSIPLASIDFLARVDTANARSARPVDLADHDRATVARQEAQVRAAMSTANTAEDFLHSFPNSENMILPNLIQFKMKLLGLPASAVCGYCSLAVFLGLIGLLGLKRDPESSLG
jgi:hypothetical protein